MKKHVFQMRKFEKAQILPIVAIGMVAIIGLAAILLDGGVLMANRRTAQAAADAGALAGARLSCLHASPAEIVEEARHYAVDLNNADASTTASYDSGTGLVTVVAQIEQNSWFARIFGDDTLSTGASASAGCYSPSAGQRVLPIAFWYKTAPKKASDIDCETEGSCSLVNWNFTTLMNELSSTSAANLPLDDIYIVAESTKVCEKTSGGIVCAGLSANASGGNRSWIDLSTVGDTSNLQKIIKYGLDKPIYLPAWISAGSGKVTSFFKADNFEGLDPIPGYEGMEARLVIVPVYDMYCDEGSTCQPQDDPVYDLGSIHYYLKNNNKSAYRLVGFAPFVLTCVTKNHKAEFGISMQGGKCPGYYYAEQSQQDIGKDAIEGYFVDGLPVDMFFWGTEGVDAGLQVISLSD